MNIIFFGTPEYVVPILEALHKTYNNARERELIGVVTQAPQPVGRDKHIEYSAVDTFAHKHKIPIYFNFDEIPDADLAVCAAYGRIIPESVINKFSLGILNIHPSLLPQWRGASPTQAALASGEEQTGVTVIKMDTGVDTGAIVSSFVSDISKTDTNETLRARLFEETVPFLSDLIPAFVAGKVHLKAQDESKATYTRLLKKEDGFIDPTLIHNALKGKEEAKEWVVGFMGDFSLPPKAESIERFQRALTPWPGIYSEITINGEKKRIKLLQMHVEENTLFLDEVQLEGKNPVTWAQFTQGYPSASFA